MESLDQYITNAEETIKTLLTEWRPKLMASFGNIDYQTKDDATVVTQLDNDLELAIKDALRPLNDRVGFMGEEHGQEGSTDIFWLIDPIDGTEAYTRGITACRSMLSLVVNDVPEYTLVYRFPTDDWYTTRRSQGAYKNGQRITAKYRPLNKAWIECKTHTHETLMRLHDVVKAANNTHEFLYVVEGAQDGWVTYSNKGGLWDYVPRTMLMAEAGFTVRNIGSDSYDYKNFAVIAAHPDNFDELHALLSPQA